MGRWLIVDPAGRQPSWPDILNNDPSELLGAFGRGTNELTPRTAVLGTMSDFTKLSGIRSCYQISVSITYRPVMSAGVRNNQDGCIGVTQVIRMRLSPNFASL